MALDRTRYTARFVDEARDHLRRLEDALRRVRRGEDDSDGETVNAIFRSAHTLKGSSRMLKLMPISDTAHHLEDVLMAWREGALSYSDELGGLLQRAVDGLAAQVETLAAGGQPEPPDAALCAELKGALACQDAERTAPPGAAAQVGAAAATADATAPTPGAASAALRRSESVRIPLDRLDELVKLMGELVSSHARLAQRVVDCRALESADIAGEGGAPPMAAGLATFCRKLKDDVQTQQMLMEELHGKALLLRMLPLAMVFDAAPRMVRELARSIGKEADCVVEGSAIELDRQLIDRLGDPIVHLLRNALWHGIETPAQRAQAGKPERGQVSLRARQEAGGVVIEVADDGQGLAYAAIRDKAVKKGLLTVEQATSLDPAQLGELIVLPGFSTSPIITDVSGRGVGMDVVKRCVVDELHGAMQIDSTPGRGTTVRLRLPRSLALMRVLLVAAGGQPVAFVATHVDQLLQVPADRLFDVGGRQALILDEQLVPVADLAQLLALRPSPVGAQVLLLVVKSGQERLALRIDRLVDECNRVIKPLPAHLSHLPLVSGMVVSGGNALCAVLQVPALLDLARRSGQDNGDATRAARARIRVLVVDDSLNTRDIEKDVLEAHGYAATLAEDGLDGLAKARNGQFDAVLTDVEMPNMDGFALTAALRADARYRDVPIIILTSRQRDEDRRRGIEAGADAYIVKGDFDQGKLIETLSSLLG
jgi:chemotaxis protein histidine kinase CheA